MVEEVYLESAGFQTVIVRNGVEVSGLLQKESIDKIRGAGRNTGCRS